MTLHDRLKPVPFEDEGPPRPAWHAIALSAVLALVAAGMALALPYAVRRATVRPAGQTVVEPSPRATSPVVLPVVRAEDDGERNGPKNKRAGRAKGRHSAPVRPAKPQAAEVHANQQGDGRGDKNDDAGDGRSGDQDDESDDGKNDGDDGDEQEQDLPDEEDKNGKAPDHAGGPDDPDDDPGSSDGDHGKDDS